MYYPDLLGSIKVPFEPPLEAIGNVRWFEILWQCGAWPYGYTGSSADGVDFWTEHNGDGEIVAIKGYLYRGTPYNPDLLKVYWDEIHRATLDESLCTALSPLTMRVLESEHGFRLCWYESGVHQVLTRLIVMNDVLLRAAQWAWK